MAIAFQQFGLKPNEFLDLTIPQLHIIFSDPEKLDEEWRYRQMSPEVRRIADRVRDRYGRF